MNELALRSNKNNILSTVGLYSSEELLDFVVYFYFIGAIRANRIKSNKVEILEKKNNKYIFIEIKMIKIIP